MPFEIVRNDISNMCVDMIVNAASRMPRVNPGVDLAVHKRAGPELLQAREKIGIIAPGHAAVTPAFKLDAEYVIHAVSPTWLDGNQNEAALLRQTYDACLALAKEYHCQTIAFPLLAAGNHGFPRKKALQIAVSAFSEFLMEHEMQIYLVVFGKETLALSEKLFQNVTSYIDENYVRAYEAEVFGSASQQNRRNVYRQRRQAEILEERICLPCESASSAGSLESFLKKKDAGFVETLRALIKESGQKNAAIYKKANISKQHFSKLINDPNATITKPTAVAFALALELNLEQTMDLIGRAGYTLTNSSTFDLIIRYFIEHKQYNVIEINITLYDFDQSLLGSA